MPTVIVVKATVIEHKTAPRFQAMQAKREFCKWKNSHLIEENRPVSEERQRSFLNKPREKYMGWNIQREHCET